MWDTAASDISTYLYLQSKIGVIVMVAITYEFSRIFKVEENTIAISRKTVVCVTAGNFTVEWRSISLRLGYWGKKWKLMRECSSGIVYVASCRLGLVLWVIYGQTTVTPSTSPIHLVRKDNVFMNDQTRSGVISWASKLDCEGILITDWNNF